LEKEEQRDSYKIRSEELETERDELKERSEALEDQNSQLRKELDEAKELLEAEKRANNHRLLQQSLIDQTILDLVGPGNESGPSAVDSGPSAITIENAVAHAHRFLIPQNSEFPEHTTVSQITMFTLDDIENCFDD